MNTASRNLSNGERAASAGFAAGLSWLALRSSSPLLRLIAGGLASGLAWRAATGHCAAKAALQARKHHRATSERVDESGLESFPASDPPASRLPDEPPSNADAKWAAARAAGEPH
jgi:hypothetical protein